MWEAKACKTSLETPDTHQAVEAEGEDHDEEQEGPEGGVDAGEHGREEREDQPGDAVAICDHGGREGAGEAEKHVAAEDRSQQVQEAQQEGVSEGEGRRTRPR